MDYLDVSLPTPEENLALDEALLDEAEETTRPREVLRLWECTSPVVVLGSGCRFSDDVCDPACRADAVPILRRASGGGTVLLGPGCLNFCVVLPYERCAALASIDGAFAFVLSHVRDALARTGVIVEHQGISDLVYQGRKVSGSGQRRRRRNVLVHGTLLYAFDVELLEKYLPMPAPQRRPPYRRDRSHRDFVGNLPASVESLRAELRAAWTASGPRSTWPGNRVRNLVKEKYTSHAWLHRR